MYTIKRFSILSTKEFSDKVDELNKLLSYGNKFVMEFIKCMETYDTLAKQNIEHWISGMLSNMSHLISSPSKYFTYSTILSRVAFNPSQITNNEIANLIKNSYGIRFINEIKKNIVSKGKYPSLRSMNSFQYDNEYYVRVLSILILILNGEVEVERIDQGTLWDYDYNNPKLNVTKDKVNSILTEKELKRRVATLILNLNGGEGILSDIN